MTYLEFYTLATTGGDLLKRVKVAAVVWALQASALPESDPDKAGKQAFASAIFRDSDAVAIKLIWFTIATTGLTGDGSSTPDADIQTAVNNLCDTYFNQAVEIPGLNSILT